MNIEIHFDGGCQPNPGEKYGSYQMNYNGVEMLKWLRFPLGYGTNNEAEFESLETALIETIQWLKDKDQPSLDQTVCIYTDSTIVRNRLVGKNRIFKKHPSSQRMFALANRVLALLNKFRGFDVLWHGRENNVARFGH